jgi:hypothetical protein
MRRHGAFQLPPLRQEGKRVKSWLPPEDKVYKNPHSVDSFAILQLLDATLKPA